MQDNVFQQGVDLMLFGMGTVFVFLTLLVFITRMMSFLVDRYCPEPVQEAIPSKPQPVLARGVDPLTLAIIKDAIKQHRGE